MISTTLIVLEERHSLHPLDDGNDRHHSLDHDHTLMERDSLGRPHKRSLALSPSKNETGKEENNNVKSEMRQISTCSTRNGSVSPELKRKRFSESPINSDVSPNASWVIFFSFLYLTKIINSKNIKPKIIVI